MTEDRDGQRVRRVMSDRIVPPMKADPKAIRDGWALVREFKAWSDAYVASCIR